MSTKPFRFAVQSAATASGAAWRELAKQAEGTGYSTLYVADHYVDSASNGGQVLAAFPAMATAAAGRCSTSPHWPKTCASCRSWRDMTPRRATMFAPAGPALGWRQVCWPRPGRGIPRSSLSQRCA